MKSIIIEKLNGKWYFNKLLYQDLSGNEKLFVDEMIKEVKINNIEIQRVPNTDLKKHNHKFETL